MGIEGLGRVRRPGTGVEDVGRVYNCTWQRKCVEGPLRGMWRT